MADFEHPVEVRHINGNTREYAMWLAECGRCGFRTDWLPTREDARIAAREHKSAMAALVSGDE